MDRGKRELPQPRAESEARAPRDGEKKKSETATDESPDMRAIRKSEELMEKARQANSGADRSI